MPSNVAAYIAIPILTIAHIVKGEWKILWHLTTIYTSVVVLSTTSMLLDYYTGREINPAGFYLSLVTYFPLLLMLAYMTINRGPSDPEAHSDNEVNASWFRSFCALMLLGQGF